MIKIQTRLLLHILAVTGRYGPNLMTVVILVTQNNFLNGPGISNHVCVCEVCVCVSLEFTLSEMITAFDLNFQGQTVFRASWPCLLFMFFHV